MVTPQPLLSLVGSVGALELVVILAVAFLLFGPEKLPVVARRLARAAEQWRRISDDFKKQLADLDGAEAPPPVPRPPTAEREPNAPERAPRQDGHANPRPPA